MKPQVGDLFAGAGLLSGAFARAGFKTIYAAEADRRAVATFNLNHGKVAECRDVRQPREDVRCDVIVAGPPCQGFSTLGKRDRADERNELSLAVVRWVRPSGARVVIVENVPQFLESGQWRRLTERMRRLGFESRAWVLDAFDYGSPQRRKRSFTVYSKIGLPELPGSAKRRITVRDAFEGLGLKPDVDGMHTAPAPSKLAYERFVRIPIGGSRADLMTHSPHLCPPSWRRLGPDVSDVWGRMRYDTPSNTLRCCFQNPSKGRYIHPVEHRVITLREGARLQGVPDSWMFVGDRTSVARQIGNGVPIPLGYAVAKSVSELF